MLLLLGIVVGAGSVLFVQERYLPPRLSAEASAQLRDALERADAERQRLRSDLGATADRLRNALDENKRLQSDVSTRGETVQHLRDDVASLVGALPPDPRNTPIAVRAARFEVQGNVLAYNVVLSRDHGAKTPFGGLMQLVVAGASGRAGDAVMSPPQPVSVGLYDSVRGSVSLPQGFRPRQATIRVLDKPGGKLMGQRVMNVN